MGKTRPGSQGSCAVCAQRRAGGVELYEIREGEDRYLFNVDKAKEIVADRRPARSLPTETLEKLIAVNDYDPQHLPHVDPGRPGIVLMRFGGLVLVDGAHRAARCLRERRAFRVQALNYQESQNCLVRQEVAREDAAALVRKLRKVMASSPGTAFIEAELACGPETLKEVRALLTREENRRLRLRAVAGRGGPPGP